MPSFFGGARAMRLLQARICEFVRRLPTSRVLPVLSLSVTKANGRFKAREIPVLTCFGRVGFGIVDESVGICSQQALGCKHSFAIFAPPIVGELF